MTSEIKAMSGNSIGGYFAAAMKARANSFESLALILERVDGGIYKRIDENRELLEFLNEKAPKLLEDHPWVIGWIKSNDDYFTNLESLVGPLHATNSQFKKNADFPRPWPVIPEKSQA